MDVRVQVPLSAPIQFLSTLIIKPHPLLLKGSGAFFVNAELLKIASNSCFVVIFTKIFRMGLRKWRQYKNAKKNGFRSSC